MTEESIPPKVVTPDAGADQVRDAVEATVRSYPEFEDAVRMYGAVMEIQRQAVERLDFDIEMSPMDIDMSLRLGDPLVDREKLEIDPGEYRRIAVDIARVVDEMSPSGTHLADVLSSWKGLSDERVEETREAVLAGELLDLDDGLKDREEIVSRILWESLAPFYRKCGSMLAEMIDYAIWQRGSCPVCGSAPLIGKFREGDGMWLLECSLCHTMWSVQRASCPFCSESQGSLGFLYVDDDRSMRVQYCEACKRYVKTVDLREGEGGTLLPLLDIVTVRLDEAAKGEGLEPARG